LNSFKIKLLPQILKASNAITTVKRDGLVRSSLVEGDETEKVTFRLSMTWGTRKLKGAKMVLGPMYRVEAGNTKGKKYHCTIDLLYDWFGLVCFANKNKNCQLSYS